MNRAILLLVLMLAAAHASVIYTVDTDRSGSSSVAVSIEGSETVNVSLPGDAGSFRIVGGSYSVSGDSAIVKSGASGLTTFSFSTSDFTSKLSSGWKLSFSAPEGSAARVSMPSRVTIENMFPAPKAVSAEDSRTSIDFENPGLVTIYYRLEDAAASPPDNSALYILAAAALVAIGIVAASFVLKRPIVPASPPVAPVAIPPASAAEKQPTLDLTPGKREMMETFNENDLVIVNCLLTAQGKSRRNELERKSGVSKSSLAMALNRLEKRKILEIDRTSTTHFVKLSDYFLKL